MNAVIEKTETGISAKVATRKPKARESLDERIAKAEALAENLRKMKAEQERKAREGNQKEILRLIARAGLDGIGIDVWQLALPEIERVLRRANGEKKPS